MKKSKTVDYRNPYSKSFASVRLGFFIRWETDYLETITSYSGFKVTLFPYQSIMHKLNQI